MQVIEKLMNYPVELLSKKPLLGMIFGLVSPAWEHLVFLSDKAKVVAVFVSLFVALLTASIKLVDLLDKVKGRKANKRLIQKREEALSEDPRRNPAQPVKSIPKNPNQEAYSTDPRRK